MTALHQLLVRMSMIAILTTFFCASNAQFNSLTTFETDLGIWNDGGADALRTPNNFLEGNYSIRLRDNSNQNSSIISNNLDLSGIDKLLITFKYYPDSMEPGEDFFLEYSSNGGATYETLGRYVSGVDFTNGTQNFEVVSMDRNFGSQNIFRFRCDASSNFDKVYLDDIIIEEDSACFCPQVYLPVCGTDGKTYGNACEAACAGVGVASEGACNPFEECESNFFSTIDFTDLCSQCLTEIALFSYQGQPYIVYFPNNITCADGAIIVTDCQGNLFCQQGGFGGLTECESFFASASKIKTLIKEDCGCFCNTEDAPVCGIDGETYGNSCQAFCAGVPVAYNGICDCVCTTEYVPVCGTDGITYSNACFAACSGVGVASQGACDPIEECENAIANMNFDNLCSQCVTEVALYSYQGNGYLVYFPDNINCADGTIMVTDCQGNQFCQQGGIAGLAECNAFFASAIKIRTVAKETCGCICPTVIDPVCGVDGNTYINACEAECNGVAVAQPGPCDPLQYCESNIANLDLSNLCARCITRIDLFEYLGDYYVVTWPNNVTCADAAVEVTDCLGQVFCFQGGFAGLNECQAFFASATKVRTLAQESCGCFCTSEYDPVCGIDGETYSNGCTAFCAGIPVAYQGGCNNPCPCDTDEYVPVCGVDGNTYNNSCEAACAGVAVASQGECDCPLYNSQGFESQMGIWRDGGADCFRKLDSQLAPQGNYSVRLRDNSGQTSSTYTNTLNFSGANKCDIEFLYRANSMEPGEDFMLEYSRNGGQTFTLIRQWVSGTDFQNGQTRSISESIYDNFTDQTVFRIRCDASSNFDQVYIDNIRISVCGNIADLNNVEVINASTTASTTPQAALMDDFLGHAAVELENEDKLIVYPNPTTHMLHIKGLAGRSYELYNLTGEMISSDNKNETLDLSSYPQGTYLLRTNDGELMRICKI